VRSREAGPAGLALYRGSANPASFAVGDKSSQVVGKALANYRQTVSKRLASPINRKETDAKKAIFRDPVYISGL
jgi:hypothetical protein